MPQQLDDGPPGRGIAAGSPAQRLAEGAGEDVDAPHGARGLRRAPAMAAHKAHRVTVIHHHQGAELVGQVADGRQIGDKAVHGEHAVGGDELDAGIRRRLQLFPQVEHIVVAVPVPAGLAQAYPVDDGGVVQLVGDDGVLGAQQGLEQAAVGVEAAGIEDGVVHAQERSQPLFQFLVDGLGAADEPHAGQPEPVLVIAGLGGGDELRVVGQAQVVVGAHVEHGAGLGGVDAGPLGRGDDPLLFIGSLRLDARQLPFKDVQTLVHAFSLQSRITLPDLPVFITWKPFSNSV